MLQYRLQTTDSGKILYAALWFMWCHFLRITTLTSQEIEMFIFVLSESLDNIIFLPNQYFFKSNLGN